MINPTEIDTHLLECARHKFNVVDKKHIDPARRSDYGVEFILAAAKLGKCFTDEGMAVKNLMFKLSDLFIANNIKSCRNTKMTVERVKYLYKRHLKDAMAMLK